MKYYALIKRTESKNNYAQKPHQEYTLWNPHIQHSRISNDRKAVKVIAWEQRWVDKKAEKTFGEDRYFHYPEYSDNIIGINSSKYITHLNMCT